MSKRPKQRPIDGNPATPPPAPEPAPPPRKITADELFASLPGNPGVVEQAVAVLEVEIGDDGHDGEFFRDACIAATLDPGWLRLLLAAREDCIGARADGYREGQGDRFAWTFGRHAPPGPADARGRRKYPGSLRESVEARVWAALGRRVSHDLIREATPPEADKFADKLARGNERFRLWYRSLFVEAVEGVLDAAGGGPALHRDSPRFRRPDLIRRDVAEWERRMREAGLRPGGAMACTAAAHAEMVADLFGFDPDHRRSYANFFMLPDDDGGDEGDDSDTP